MATRKTHIIIADKTDYNQYMHNYQNIDSLFHSIHKALDKKYTITEYDNNKHEKTSKQQTFMFHYNNYDLDKKTTDDITKKIKQNPRIEKYNDIVQILYESGYHKLKNKNITINETTIETEPGVSLYDKYINKIDTLKDFKMYDDKQHSIYSMNNFLSRIALKTKQIGRWFSDAWTSLKWRFMDWNTPAKTNLNDINKGRNRNIVDK